MGYAIDFLAMLESELQVPIKWLGTGFGTFQAIANSTPVRELFTPT